MQRAIVLAATLAATGCYDGPTSDSSVFECYCTGEIARMLNDALEIATVQDDGIRADCEAFATTEAERVQRDRGDPSFYWLDARVVALEARIRDLEAALAATRADGSSPDP
jgi:hypothetical protein